MIESVTTKNTIYAGDLINSCLQLKLPFALYRLPGQSVFQLIISENKLENRKKIDFEECKPGFVIAPFDNHLPYFYEADHIFTFENNEIPKDFIPDFLKIINKNTDPKDTGFSFVPANEDSNESREYSKKIEAVIQRITGGESQKVVISRKKHLGTILEKNYFKAFKTLSNSYPSAFVSVCNVPWKNQIWIGASPEILVTQNEKGIFKTVALAGTQSALNNSGEEIRTIDALWSHKEIEEQALVSRYIINCLKKIRVREYQEYGPKTVKAGNLLHLCSTYSIDSKEINFSNLSSVMLDLLHPTSAVCGIPKEPSLQIIKEIENYDREFYSGYLGPVNIQNESHVFVNLRSMKIENDEIFAFAGGGITEDSVPEKEWNETEIKLKTIQKSFDF